MYDLSSVQHECIPQAILGMDILCQAKSGMGKTAVFVLATLQQIEPVDGQVCVHKTRSCKLNIMVFLPICLNQIGMSFASLYTNSQKFWSYYINLNASTVQLQKVILWIFSSHFSSLPCLIWCLVIIGTHYYYYYYWLLLIIMVTWLCKQFLLLNIFFTGFLCPCSAK